MENGITYKLSMVPRMDKLGFKTFELASTVTTVSSVQGSAGTNIYGLTPAIYAKKAVDAARERLRFLDVVTQVQLAEGAKDYFMAKRKKYLADSSWETSSEEYSAGNEISWTQINTADSVQFTPTYYNYGVAISNKAIMTNALDQVTYCREELAYKYENSVDSAIRDALLGTFKTDASGEDASEPTPMSNTVNGAQTIFGGDATNADDSLDSGDILTTSMISKAIRLLTSNHGYYWSSNTFTKSAVTKNAWEPTPDEPFVLFIAPEQRQALQDDSQFVNASEYGSDEVVLHGEIGQYLGVKVVCTSKVPAFSNAGVIRVQGANVSTDVNGHICGLVKAKKCGAIVWGRQATVKVFDWPNADQIRMKLSLAYEAKAVHPDAIVRLVVADE